MKITHIVSSLQIGGAERFAIDLSEIQNKLNHTAEIVSFGKKNDQLVKVCESKNINVEIVPRETLKKIFSLFKYLSNADIIHLHSPSALRACIVHLFFMFYKKTIYTRHGERTLSSKSWLKLHKFAKHIINHVTFVSEKGKDVFIKYQKWNKVPHHVIENGVNLPAKDIFIKNDSYKLRLGSVGRMVKLKNQISLLKALSYIEKKTLSNIEIHFFGEGESQDILKKYTINHLADDIVTFHGEVTDRVQIYNSFDVLVVTSETEGLSLAILEAMAFSHPVLATPVGGNPRLVLHEKTGFLFDYNDSEALANYIEKLAYNSSLVIDLGTNAKNHIIDNYSLENTAKKYTNIYS